MELLTRKLPVCYGWSLVFMIAKQPCNVLVGSNWVGNGMNGFFLKKIMFGTRSCSETALEEISCLRFYAALFF